VYSIAEKASLDTAREIILEIKETKQDQLIVITLVGNKTDLPSTRVIPTETGMQL
jgi:GTPase SAR1 family protein